MTKHSTNLPVGRPRGVTSFELKPAKAFGQVLRSKRVVKGLSQEDLGALAGIPRNYIGNIERGENMPTLGIVFRLAKALEISAGIIVTETEELLKQTENEERE